MRNKTLPKLITTAPELRNGWSLEILLVRLNFDPGATNLSRLKTKEKAGKRQILKIQI